MSDLPPPSFEHRPVPAPGPSRSVYRRRRIAVGAGVVVVAALLAGGTMALVGDEGGVNGSAGWNAVLVVDSGTGAASLVDADGDEIDDVDVDAEVPLLLGTRGRYVLVGDLADMTNVSVIDATTGEITSLDVGQGEQARWLPTSNAPVVTIGTTEGGPLRVFHPATGGTIDVGDAAGLSEPAILAQSVFATPDGSTVVASDATTFQTVIVGFERDEPGFAKGRAAAVSEHGFVTLQQAGDVSELEFFDLQGESRGSAEVPTPRSVAMVDDSTAIVVDAEGHVVRATAGDSEAEEIELLNLDNGEVRGVTPIVDADRIVVHLDERSVLLDLDGNELTREDGARLWALGDGEPVCYAILDGPAVELYDAEKGWERARATNGQPRVERSQAAHSGGCVTDVPTEHGSTTTLLTYDGERDVDGEVIDIAPDGNAVLSRVDDEVQLISLDDPGADPIELDGTAATFVHR